jgi:hypothetical protein
MSLSNGHIAHKPLIDFKMKKDKALLKTLLFFNNLINNIQRPQ